LRKTGWHSTEIILGKGAKGVKNKIWSKTFETGRDEKRHTWAYAFFVRVKPRKFVVIDSNGLPEFAIATHDIGTSVISWVIVARAEKDKITFIEERDNFNVAADGSVFEK